MDVTRWRIALVTALGVLLALGAGGAFDATQWPLFTPIALVGIAALLAAGQHIVVRAAAAVMAIAMGGTVTVLLAGGSFADALTAVVSGPRQLITTEWPSPAVPSVIGVVAFLLAIVTAIAAELAGRARLHLAPLAPMAIGWAAVLAIGAPVRPAPWVIVAVGLISLLLGLLRHAAANNTRIRQYVRADRTVVVTAVSIIVVASGTASAVAWADRADPRRTEAAELNAPVIDPIEETVALREAEPSFSLFEITDESRLVGQSLPARWRLAALDTYDGQRWVPRLTLRPIGGRLGIPTTVDLDRPPPVSYRLRYLSDDIDLLPFPGPPLSASIDVETDVDRVAVRALTRPEIDEVITLDSEVALTSRSAIGTDVAFGQVDELALGFTELAERLAGDDAVDVVEMLRRIETEMHDDWLLDAEAPGGGQQLALIERFVDVTRRGTREQFVTAFVLLARSLGVEARVATGFIVPPGSISSPLRLDSSMAAAWPEVRMADGGWVAFDPVPATERPDDGEQPPPPDAQTPAAAQPPVEPPIDDADATDDELVDVVSSPDRWAGVRVVLVRVGAGLVVGVLPIVIAVAVVLGLKRSRRLRRLRLGDPALRIRGAWANATDSLVDAGLTIPASWTDDRIAEHGAALAPTVPHEMRRLAAVATKMTFGTTLAAGVLVDDAVFTSGAVDQAIREQMTRRERIRWRLSLRSLRRNSRSPVDVFAREPSRTERGAVERPLTRRR